jgi:hypothetical protein
MLCPERSELEKAHESARRDQKDDLINPRTGVTREQMERDTVDKAVAVQSAYDALTGHIKGCPTCADI